MTSNQSGTADAPAQAAAERLEKMPFPPGSVGENAVPGQAGSTPPQEGVFEVERYWVNEPYAFVSILYDHRAKEHTYLLCVSMLGDFEAGLLERLYSDLRDILIRSEIDSATADRHAVLRSRCRQLRALAAGYEDRGADSQRHRHPEHRAVSGRLVFRHCHGLQ